MAQFSAESLRSFSDEVPSSGSLSCSGRQQPWSHVSESKLDNGTPTTSSEEQGKQSELSDFKNNESKLSKKWINYLKDKETKCERYQSDGIQQREITPVSDEELNALRSFCAIKVNLIHHRMDSKTKKSSRYKQLQPRFDAETSEVDALNCTVPDELLNRIYLKNTKATLKQMATAKQHISSRCPNCNHKRAELAQTAFLKQKKTLLESVLLQEKIDEHLHTTDFLTRVGEAHQGLPRLSHDPQIIWKRLNEKIHIGQSSFERSETKQKM